MKLVSKTVIRHEGKSDKWPRYHIVREYYWVDSKVDENDDTLDMELFDEIFWTGNDWSDIRQEAILYVNLKNAIEDKDKIEENLTS